MRKYVLIHIPHSSIFIPTEYKKEAVISQEELNNENLFMCDYKVDELLDDKSQAIIFQYSRLYCDVERFRDDSEIMNKYGMGYIYTKTSDGMDMFNPSVEHKKLIDKIYDEHHRLLDDKVSEILDKYQKCILIDLHSYSDEQVLKLFNYKNVPDICIGIENNYYNKELVDYFVDFFTSNGYSVKINYPYKGSIIPNKFYGKNDTGIISIMIEINKRVYTNDFDNFKKVLNKSLKF